MITPLTSSRPLTLEEADALYREHLAWLLDADSEREEAVELDDQSFDQLFAACVSAVDFVR